MCGYPILGNDDCLQTLRLSVNYALITVGQIGSPSIRLRLFKLTATLGFMQPVIISPRAYVSRLAQIGPGTIIMHDALVNSRATIGSNCIINTKALIEHDVRIEDNCHIATSATVNGGTIVRQGTFIGSHAATKEYVTTGPDDFIKAGSFFTGYTNAQQK